MLTTSIPSTTMEDFEISAQDILLAISKMKGKINRTPDGIPSFFIKHVALQLLTPLLIIFNSCLKFSLVPLQWKTALVVPIFKKGDKSYPKNYRPISLTSSFSRLFEAILHKKITTYLTQKNYYLSFQPVFYINVPIWISGKEIILCSTCFMCTWMAPKGVHRECR